MTFDKIELHYGAEDFPKELKRENGGTHIGMFLAWVIMNHLEGVIHITDSRKSLEKVRKRKMTGRDFLIQECDEKLWDEDFNDEANGFAKDYYEANSYLEDYKKILKANLPTLYHVEDTWENYDKIASTITWRFSGWKIKRKLS